MQTSSPSRAKYTAMFVASVLLPQPPFAFKTITWRIIPRAFVVLSKTSSQVTVRAAVETTAAPRGGPMHRLCFGDAHRLREDAGAWQRFSGLRRPGFRIAARLGAMARPGAPAHRHRFRPGLGAGEAPHGGQPGVLPHLQCRRR